MQVNFFLKEPEKIKTSIQAIIRYKGNRFKISTGVSVEVNYWDKSEHRAKRVREYSDHETINIILDRFEAAAKTLFSDAAIAKKIPTIEEIKKACKTPNQTIPEENKMPAFLEYFQRFIDAGNYKHRTRLNYETTLKVLLRYESHIGHRLQFADINIDFYNSFTRWIAHQAKPNKDPKAPKKYYSINTFGGYIKHIKAIMRESGPEGGRLHENVEYKHRKFVKTTETTDSVYLSTAELTRINQLKINYKTVSAKHPDLTRRHVNLKADALIKCKNFFLIGCYTALRISDFARLDNSNISDKYIRIKPLKGKVKNEDVIIPIHPVIAEILKTGFDITERIGHQKLNEHVKELCQMAEINDLVTVVRTEGGRQISRTSEKWKLVTSHTARRSGATNMFKAGIPAISIMKITGHRTERSFMKYIRISQEENAILLAEHPFFKAR